MARVRLSLWGAGMLAFISPAAAYAVDCFVDSVAGNDTKSGLSEAEAIQSLAKIPSSCTTVKFKRGSVFNIPAGSGKYAVNLMGRRSRHSPTTVTLASRCLNLSNRIKQAAVPYSPATPRLPLMGSTCQVPAATRK
jgi:hypothetical protein